MRPRDNTELQAVVKSVLPGATCIGFHPDGTCSFELDDSWTYDDIKRLSDLIGTTHIDFVMMHDDGYSEYTPGGRSSLIAKVRWS